VSEPTTQSADQSVDRPSVPAESAETPSPDALVEQELIVEDVSIDGMCGVY
jgi:mycofactocin precursor